jgi:hypothetical protein
MADIAEVVGGTIGSVSFAASAAVASILPLCAELDAFIGVTLGPLQADLTAQFRASADFALNASLGITTPFLSVQLVLQALVSLQGALQASLALPSIALTASVDVSASLALTAALGIKLGLLNAAVKAMLVLKIGAVELAGQIGGVLSAGPVVLVEFGGLGTTTLAGNGANIAGLFATGLSLGGGILPLEIAEGYILVTKAPAAKAGLDFILRGI